MKRYIAIDGGTTNVRLFYTEGENISDVVKKPVGAGNGDLPNVAADTIRALISRFGTPDAVLAAGMITSELGLYAVPHIPTPAGPEELHGAMQAVSLPEIAQQPIYFIPGLKQVGDDFLDCDLMRGEECEIFGLMKPEDGRCVYVLPGSHSKHITVENGKIAKFSTFLSGEMAAALSAGTILRHSVDMMQPIDTKSLYTGCEYANRGGLNKALFKVRVMDTVYNNSPSAVYGFYLGAVLSAEIKSLAAVSERRIIIAGQPQLAEATSLLLRHFTDKDIQLADATRAAEANVRGMIKIFEA